MKMNEIKWGMKVEDTWFWDWGIGVVKKKGKTRVVIQFANPDPQHSTVEKEVTYDKEHVQFLKEYKE